MKNNHKKSIDEQQEEQFRTVVSEMADRRINKQKRNEEIQLEKIEDAIDGKVVKVKGTVSNYFI